MVSYYRRIHDKPYDHKCSYAKVDDELHTIHRILRDDLAGTGEVGFWAYKDNRDSYGIVVDGKQSAIPKYFESERITEKEWLMAYGFIL